MSGLLGSLFSTRTSHRAREAHKEESGDRLGEKLFSRVCCWISSSVLTECCRRRRPGKNWGPQSQEHQTIFTFPKQGGAETELNALGFLCVTTTGPPSSRARTRTNFDGRDERLLLLLWRLALAGGSIPNQMCHQFRPKTVTPHRWKEKLSPINLVWLIRLG